MNIVTKILQSVIIVINSLLDKLNTRMAETIKQSYYLVIFILVIVAVALGIINGKGSAQKAGIQMAGETNKIFEIEIKQSRDDASFGTLLESELRTEKEMIALDKKKFPAKESLITEKRDQIIEAEKDKKNKFLEPGPIDNNTPIGIKRTEDEPIKAYIKQIGKNELTNKKKREIIHDKINPIIKDKSLNLNKRSENKIKPKSTQKLPVIHRKSEVKE